MNIITSANQAICGIFNMVTTSTAAVSTSIEAGANMVHNRVKESDLTDLEFVQQRTAATMQKLQDTLDADPKLKAMAAKVALAWDKPLGWKPEDDIA